jgi:hypothetical protein
MPLRCDFCGKFVSYKNFDEYTDFGECTDPEPPDPIVLCPKCSKKKEDAMVAIAHVCGVWIYGKCHRRAAKRLGFRRCGPRYAAWYYFRNPADELPRDWEWRDE